jgi:hypothetical protein
MDSTDLDIPDFAALAADPEIAPLLDFEPVVRQVIRPNGWFPHLQRELIARLAATGTLQKAVWQMGKHATGAEGLYQVPGAHSFRAAWDSAIAIGRRRNGLDAAPPYAGEVPGITRRSRNTPPLDGEGQGWGDAEPELDPEEKMAMVENLARKFMLKVMAEREARLEGDVVTADFYLRQVTMLEVAFDLLAEKAGLEPWQILRECRRGGHGPLDIVETPLSRALDQMRRDYWRDQGLPERPEHPPERYCEPFVLSGVEGRGYRLEPLQNAFGAMSIPALGFTAEEWAKMDYDAQVAARNRQFEQDAAAQVDYERRAGEAWRSNLERRE